MESEIEKLKMQLLIAENALKQVAAWDDDLEDEWSDPGYLAKDALDKIAVIERTY